ncbi:hypothetical protein [Microcella alkalica]|uniref:hypothetical protein n=1 Tax=Microcella alkalica TaxID=355930 RepID=UPI00145D352A|nr:hypothetical protein [Microcella alkalica]
MSSKNISAAIKALDAELSAGHVEQEDVAAYLASVDEVIETARAVKKLYAAEVAREASKKSRAKKAAEVAAMQARLAELEASATA